MKNNSTAASNVIPFRNAQLLLTQKDGIPFVPMKPVVEGMGLDWSTQHRKLQGGRFNSVMVMMTTTGADGKRYDASCLPLRKLSGWLMSIHASKVRPELREGVIAYQNECDDALWAYWNDGIAIKHHDRDAASVLGTTIGTDGFHCLGAVLGGKVRHLPVPARKRATMHVWSQVHKAFSVVSAQDIPADQMDSARNFIAAYSLDGEWIPKEKPSERFNDWLNLNALITCMQRTQELWRQHGLYQHLTHGGSRVGVEMLDYIQDGHLVASMLKREYSAQLDSSQRLASEACNRALATA